MLSKVCNKCKENKELSEFYFDKRYNMPRGQCKKCVSVYSKIRRMDENVKINEYNRAKKYYNLNKDGRNKYQREYYKVKTKDPLYKLKLNIKCGILNSFRRNKIPKSSNTSKILGCTFEELKKYLESKFELWMSWDNHGLYNGELNYGWDIDHIIPSSSAKTEDELIKLNHYTNLQPLCSKINRDIKKDNLI